MSGRGTITRRAVFSSRFSTFSIIIRSLRDRWPPATLSATISRSSSSLWASSAVLVWPRPSTQSVRLLALFKSQITGEKTYDRITSGGAVSSTRTLGARIARLLGACSPSAMCRKVTSESAAMVTVGIEMPKTTIGVARMSRLREARLDHRLDPVVHRPSQRQAGDRDPDLGSRQVEIEPIEGLAGQLGCPVALLGELVDLGRPHLDQGELDRDEKPVDQDQTRDEQDLKVSHVGRNPVLTRVAQAEVERKSRRTRPVRPHQRIGGNP